MTFNPIRLLILVLFLTNVVSISEAKPHDTPDDFIERAVAVVIRDRQIEVSIQIGINAKTMRDKLATWEVREEFENETELTHRFCEEVRNHLAKKFELQLDGERIDMEVASVDPFAEHHKTAVMKLVAELPDGSTGGQLTLQDASFMKLDGAVRYSIKGRGKTLVTKSNAAPIIIRAKRIELGALDADQRSEVCQIKAKVKTITP